MCVRVLHINFLLHYIYEVLHLQYRDTNNVELKLDIVYFVTKYNTLKKFYSRFF
jgi:hypothetical protein